MTVLQVNSPFPVFTGLDGQPLDSGAVYVGVAGLDPIANPVPVYWDDAFTIPASQPLTTSGGYVIRLGTPAQVFANAADVSVLVRDQYGVTVFSGDVSAGGSVTSVAASGGTTGFSFTGSPITTSGTLTLTVANAATARGAISAAASGANTDITSLEQDVTIAETGTAAANTIGFRGLPVVTTTGKTLELSDAGKTVYTSGNIVIPAESVTNFPIGSAIEISNSTNATVTVSITTDTLRQSGTTNTGTRTLAVYGDCVVKKRASGLWHIAGNVS